ncbi:MAG: hypothetical protein KF773_29080 [Deltaproteobacteria bacterium]|nr:hypothetical protein [Deltaproteobacteria bacterium]
MMGPRALVALVLMVGVAAAQPPGKQGAPSSDPKVQAGELVRKAITKSQANDHDAAIELYLQAYTLSPQPTLLSNIASEYQMAKKPVEALRYFCMYLEKDPTGTSAPYATSKAKALAIELGNKDVTDATVCKPAAVEPPKKDPDEEPKEPPPPPPPPPPKPRVVDRGKGLRATGLVTGAAGLVALGVSVYFGLEAKKISDDITNHCANQDPCPAWPENIRELQDRGQAHEDKQVILLVAGGAAVVTGTVLYVIGRSKKTTERVAVTPVVTPDAVAIGFSGRF